MSNSYQLAIIIPCWNCGIYLKELLDSIISQTFQDWNVFCIDDQSTDETQKVLRDYSQKDKRIHFHIRDRLPKGAQTCRNIGFNLSKGAKYVMWFDGDDLIAPYCFSQRVEFMESHDNLDFGVFLAKTFKETISEVPTHIFGFRYSKQDDLRRFLRRDLPFVVWNNIYRRASVINYELEWDEHILSLQDSVFNIQTLLKGLNYDYCDDCKIDYFWRVGTSDSISKKIFTKAHKKSHLYFIDILYNSLTNEQRKEYKIELDDYLFFFIDKFYFDKSFIFSLLNRKWLRKRPFFCLKVLLYCSLHKRGKAKLFPELCSYRNEDDSAISQFHQHIIEQNVKNSTLKNLS